MYIKVSFWINSAREDKASKARFELFADDNNNNDDDDESKDNLTAASFFWGQQS